MTRRTHLQALAIALLLAGTWLWVAAAAPVRAAETPRVGAAAPEFSLPDEQGAPHKLSDYRGKLVVLEWTNPECPYVKRHYREGTMEKLSEEFDSDVVWLAINSTRSNTPEESQAWKQEQGFEYATLQDAAGEVGHLYGARTTPNMYVIDSEGVLRYSGAIDDDPRGRTDRPRNYVSGAIEALLAAAAPDPSETRPYGCSVKYK
jgi:peroxiredoxin